MREKPKMSLVSKALLGTFLFCGALGVMTDPGPTRAAPPPEQPAAPGAAPAAAAAPAPREPAPEPAKATPSAPPVAAARIEDTQAVRTLSRISRETGGSGDGVAALINLNGHLCAEPIEALPHRGSRSVFDVTCIEYRGGHGLARYRVDGAQGRVPALR